MASSPTLTPAKMVAALCLLSAVLAQQGNFVDEGGFDYDQPAPPPRAAPRPAAAFRPTSSLSAAPKPTPVPILKQINRHNEDGSYTYGYEGADGAFKIETKLPSGEVMGKYGYVDDTGKVRVVEYGANKYGFQPAGEGITVAPPTLVDESVVAEPARPSKKGVARPVVSNEPVEYDDGQYYEEAPVKAPPPPPRPVARPAPRPAPRPVQQSAPQSAPQPQYSQSSFPSFQSAQNFGPSRPTASFSSLGPAPPRASIPGAAPVGPSPSFSQAAPRPAARPAPRPQPQQSFFSPAPAGPAPVYERTAPVTFAQQPQPQPQPSRASYGRSGGILDQLEKDYALPSNSAPALHDITFGSF